MESISEKRARLIEGGSLPTAVRQLAFRSAVPEFEFFTAEPLFSRAYPLVSEDEYLLVVNNEFRESVRPIVALTDFRIFVCKETQLTSVLGWEMKQIREMDLDVKAHAINRLHDIGARATHPGNLWATKSAEAIRIVRLYTT